jgi:nucleotide-binding universal stress UspA family protein
MSSKIVIGYQPTPEGEDALALGRIFAESLDSTPIIATALPLPASLIGSADLERALAFETAESFAVACDRLQPLIAETRALADPSAAAALHDLAEAEYASLIVVGSPHRGPPGRVLIGGVAKSLLHGAPCAVTVAPRGFAPASGRRLRRIAVAFDGSAEAWAALETAIAFAERGEGSLRLLAVAEPLRFGLFRSFAVLSTTESLDLERREKERILELARHRVPSGLQVDSRLLAGESGPALAKAAVGFDLIVSGSRGYGPLRRTIIGSTATSLIRSAPCPVLVLPRAAGIDPLDLDKPPDAHRDAPLPSVSIGY